MAILFYLAHKKFVKILRSYADRGTIINITEHDRERLSLLLHRTDNALERHKCIYRVAFEILNRNSPSKEGYTFTHEMVDTIEIAFVKAERSKPCDTFREIAIVPLLKILLKRSGKIGK